ncbi:TPA: hypothetical protein ACQ54Y_005130, partial [Klebsiella pneumoniae]
GHRALSEHKTLSVSWSHYRVNAAHRYDEIQLNYRDGGERNSEGGIQFNSGSAIKKASMKPITPDEFRVMKSYLNVM